MYPQPQDTMVTPFDVLNRATKSMSKTLKRHDILRLDMKLSLIGLRNSTHNTDNKEQKNHVTM